MLKPLNNTASALSLEEYQDIFDNISSIIIYTDPKRKIKFVSSHCLEISGFTEEEIRKNPFCWIDNDEINNVKATINYVFHQVLPGKNFEYRAIKKDGSFWYASTTWQPIIKNGENFGFVFTTYDITWKKLNEGLIQSSKDRLSSVFESTLDRITVWDRNYNIVYANEAELMFYGKSKSEIFGHKVVEIFREENISFDNWKKRVEIVFESGRPQKFEVPYLKDDKDTFYEVLISPIVTDTGDIQAAVIVYRDISERKKQEGQLQSLNKKLAISNSELEQFAYIASHDLQEPLRAITGFIQLLRKKNADKLDDSALHLIDRSVGAAERMRGLIQDLLSFSRVTSKKIAFQDTNMNEVVNLAIQNLELTIQETNTTIELENLHTVKVDSSQMVQVFQNLIANGIKFTKKNKCEIRIFSRYDEKNKETIFSVQDNGIGIEDVYKKRIFLIFQRLHNIQEYSGSGIGLAICKRILERHNGKIWVDSQFGKGSVFSFSIPDNRRNYYDS